MKRYFADLHIHIGRTVSNKPVKITASDQLTFANIIEEAHTRKGIDIVGIVDCASPPVMEDIGQLISQGALEDLSGGGYLHQGRTLVILGVEVEIHVQGYGTGHFLCYFDQLSTMKEFSQWLAQYTTNIQLSTQLTRVPLRDLQQRVKQSAGLFVPAHIFTPHKGLYGNMTASMAEILDVNAVDAVELGLSADTFMAARLKELHGITTLANSDAHSLAKIAREYNELQMESLSFAGLAKALHKIGSNRVLANYGMEPRLGKYHRSFCLACSTIAGEDDAPPIYSCPQCKSENMTIGVLDRIVHIAGSDQMQFSPQQQYHYQIPIEFIPGIGRKTLNKLYDHFATEMNILHQVPYAQLAEVVGAKLATAIESGRTGKIKVNSGGGGIYGNVQI